jgi:putative redox protein
MLTALPSRECQSDIGSTIQLREALMEVTVEHLGAVQFEIKARQHAIACDQPAEDGGFDEGMTPPELFLAAVGSCAGFYAVQYLRKHKIATEGTRVRVAADKLKNPARLDNFHIEVEPPVALSDEQRAGVEASVHHCLIHNTLLHPPQIAVEVRVTVNS